MRPAAVAPSPISRAGRLHSSGLALWLAALLLAIPVPASADSLIGAGLSQPSGITSSAKEGGDVYVTDVSSGQRVAQFEPDGTFVRAFGWGVLNGAPELQTCTTATLGECHDGSNGSGPGQLNWSDEIAVNNDSSSGSEYGDVYVVDQRNNRIQKYSPSGQFLLMFGGEVNKTAVAESATRSAEENVCPAPGHPGDVCGAGAPGTAPGFFEEQAIESRWSEDGSNSIAVGPDGTVYVGDFRRVQEFEHDGAYKGSLTLPGQQFVSSLAVDAASHVYALSPALNEVQQILPPASGTYELCFKGPCTEPIPYNAEDHPGFPGLEPIREALEKLPTIGAGNVRAKGLCGLNGKLGRCEEFTGSLAHAEQPLITATVGSVERFRYGAPGELVKLAGPAAVNPSEVLQAYDTEPGAEPTHIALDPAGNLFVTDFNGGNFQFRAFRPNGSLYAEFTSELVSAPYREAVRGIAIGSGNLYVSDQHQDHIAVIPLSVVASGPPIVSGESAGNLEPTTATLHAVVNPKGFDTHYRFQYITQKHCEENEGAGHECFLGAEEKPSAPGEDIGQVIRDDPVSQAVSGLEPETSYRYRAVAESECNGAVPPAQSCSAAEEGTFTTLPPVAIRDFTTQTVGPEVVEIKAEVSPNNGTATHWEICLGTDMTYSLGCVAGTLHVLGNEYEEVTVRFEHLNSNTTYHYRLTAENSYNEKVESQDQTLLTELSAAEERAAEDCLANGSIHGAPGGSTLREQNSSLALPDCRAYEQVSPTEKAGYGVDTSLGAGGFNFAPGGEHAMFDSSGAFAGAVWSHSIVQYYARRTPTRWLTQAVFRRPVPDSEPAISPLTGIADPELDKWIFAVIEGVDNFKNRASSESGSDYFGLADGSTVKATPTFSAFGGGQLENPQYEPFAESPDLSSLLIKTGTRFLESDPRSTSGGSQYNRLYEVSGAGGAAPSLSLIAEVPASFTGSNCEIDQTVDQGRNLVSTDGATVFYTAPLELQAGASCGTVSGEGPNPSALFVRVGGAPAIQLSVESPTQCAASSPCHGAHARNARFYGATPSGSAAWFTTTQPLTDSDTDTTNDLYLAKLAGGQLSGLVQASAGKATANHPTPGQGAGVQGVLGVSNESNRAYFVASGELTAAPNPTTGQSAAPGADNLYAYDAATEETKFIARLCSGPKESGSVKDPSCGPNLSAGIGFSAVNDSKLWENGQGKQAQLTPDGRYLLFSTYAQLTPDDTDTALDVYRYDFQTGRLTRLSFGRNGNDANGNDNAFNAEITALPSRGELPHANQIAADTNRAISADGSAAIFRTTAPLTSRDTNLGGHPGCHLSRTGCDVYEWEEDGHGTCAEAGGCVRLLSDGLDPHGTFIAAIDSSGRNVAFITDRGLAPADTDGVADVYDARVEGGFPPPPLPEICKSAETCHGPPTTEQLHPSYTSGEFEGPPPPKYCPKGFVLKRGHCVKVRRHHRKRHHKRAARANRRGAK